MHGSPGIGTRNARARLGALIALLGLALGGLASGAHAQSTATPPVGLPEWGRLDTLPRFRTAVKTAMLSSYDRTGGNDDGFSGRYSFLRKEGDGLVIADLKGPGCVYRIWTPTPTDDPVEFYFDGETQPRLKVPFRKLFDGTQAPFTAPLSGYGAGGFWTYLPLPYRQSLKVVVRGPRVQFYQLNYATYPEGHPVTTFRPEDALAPAAMEPARRLFNARGADLAALAAPEGARVRTKTVSGRLSPGKALTLFSAKRGGRVVGLRLRPASALLGKDRGIVLRAYWDGDSQPAIWSPAGDFFGFSWGEAAARSLLFGTEADTCYAWFPMPYDREARIELLSERASGDVEIQADVFYADTPRAKDEGRFYAFWRRENPTTPGKPHTFIDVKGRGHIVGVSVQAQGKESGNTYFFEGDDQATLDGELVAHGTGSEDFFNGGWYDVPGRWDTRLSFPLSGNLDYKKHLGRTGAYRLFLTDPYVFRNSALLTIEHGPTENALKTDYASVAYLYLQDPPATRPAPVPLVQRSVEDLTRLIFTPGWNVPLHAFPFQNATLAKKNERIAGADEVRYLSLRASGEDVFGQHALALTCEAPQAGRYRIGIEALKGPDQAQVQLFQNERAMGPVVDLYAETRAKSPLLNLGELTLAEGPNPIFVKLVGRNAKSTGLGLDLVTLQLERIGDR